MKLRNKIGAFAASALAAALLVPAAIVGGTTANAVTLPDTAQGMNLGSGELIKFSVVIDQANIKTEGLAAVKKWRQHALDNNAKWPHPDSATNMRQYLAANGISEEVYLNPSWSYDLERIAIQRAVETLSKNIGHTRPNSTKWNTLRFNGTGMSSEGLAWSSGSMDITGAINIFGSEFEHNWEQGDELGAGHWKDIVNPDNLSYGFGLVPGGLKRPGFCSVRNIEIGRNNHAQYSLSRVQSPRCTHGPRTRQRSGWFTRGSYPHTSPAARLFRVRSH